MKIPTYKITIITTNVHKKCQKEIGELKLSRDIKLSLSDKLWKIFVCMAPMKNLVR